MLFLKYLDYSPISGRLHLRFSLSGMFSQTSGWFLPSLPLCLFLSITLLVGPSNVKEQMTLASSIHISYLSYHFSTALTTNIHTLTDIYILLEFYTYRHIYICFLNFYIYIKFYIYIYICFLKFHCHKCRIISCFIRH